ncbi:hypothetical protein IWQ60_009922, partial [Tieghemiomyces parasiticus]
MMRLTTLSLYGLALLALVAADTTSDASTSTASSVVTPSSANDLDSDIETSLGSTNIIPGRYIVQFEPSVAATIPSLTDDDVTSILRKSGVDLEVKHTFSNPTFNAASIMISGNDTQPIQNLDAVAK